MPNYLTDANCQIGWLFTEGTGTTVADGSGHSRTGAFNSAGHPAWDAAFPTYGLTGQAAGSVSYATTGALEIITDSTSNLIMPSTAAWSIVAWVYPTVDVIGGGNPRLCQRSNGEDTYIGLSATTSWILQIDGGGGSTPVVRQSNASVVSLSAWQHVAFTSDGSVTAANYHIYKNGSEVAYQTTTNGVGLTNNSGATFYLGNRSDGTRAIGGKLTDVLIFDRQLSGAEVLDIYNYGPTGAAGGPTLLAWMPTTHVVAGPVKDVMIPSGMTP